MLDNNLTRELERQGFQIWDRMHEGVAFERLNAALKPHSLRVFTVRDMPEDTTWFKIVPLEVR